MKKLQSLLLPLAFIALVAGCAPVMQPPLQPLDSGASPAAGSKYMPKVDNFQVILDSSLSMDDSGKNSFVKAREVVRRLNQGIPTDLNYQGGLRSIGHSKYQSTNPTDLLSGMASYDRQDFHNALGKVKYVGGPTPMAAGLRAAGNDLSGKSAVILVSDGLHMDDAPAAAKELKAKLGSDFCIYTIAIGKPNNGMGQDMMEQLADIGQCGFATTDAELAGDAQMAGFIDKVFVGEKKAEPKPAPKALPPRDSDGDGVVDGKDQCPNTPRGAPVNSVGCPLDSDGDGVYDYLDKCPNTAKGVSVDSTGCPQELILQINFRHDSDVVREEFMGEIARAAKCINEFPGNVVIIEGHTDSQGAAEYNQVLSERRAKAVVKALIDKHAIAASRLNARGLGETQPIGDNKTPEGRKENRRVEVACGATN